MTTEVSLSTPAKNDEEKQARLRTEREKLESMMPDSESAEVEADATRAANEKLQHPDFGIEDTEDRTVDRQVAAAAKGAVE